ncbi:hypothetical protein GCM10011583_20810 [Streptomyces camponoticapitis]|uniref:Uncharacterized protein n=1 Tax=Streptomyces camponoticapitis TaxID=1616125 RepID=A0ABQ2E249_9ACTN|nr:hypothetical protein GCM10011583_20810 [Streptomyces camponoticapitis]
MSSQVSAVASASRRGIGLLPSASTEAWPGSARIWPEPVLPEVARQAPSRASVAAGEARTGANETPFSGDGLERPPVLARRSHAGPIPNVAESPRLRPDAGPARFKITFHL